MSQPSNDFLRKLGLLLDPLSCQKLLQAAPSLNWDRLEEEFNHCAGSSISGWVKQAREFREETKGIGSFLRSSIDEFIVVLSLPNWCPKVHLLAELKEAEFSAHAEGCPHCRSLQRAIRWEPFVIYLWHSVFTALLRQNEAMLKLQMPEWEKIGESIHLSSEVGAPQLGNLNLAELRSEDKILNDLYDRSAIRLSLAACVE